MGSSRQKTYKTFFAILGVFIFVYASFKILPILRGPQIFVEGIKNGENHGPIAFISGQTKNTKELILNNNPILLDEEGNWRETLLLHEGYNVIELLATDKFGRTQIEKFKITADKFAWTEIEEEPELLTTEETETTEDIKEINEQTVLGITTSSEIEYADLQEDEEI